MSGSLKAVRVTRGRGGAVQQQSPDHVGDTVGCTVGGNGNHGRRPVGARLVQPSVLNAARTLCVLTEW